MVEVTVKNGEQLERALRRFKKKWERAGVLREVKRKSFYIKPSDLKKIRLSDFEEYLKQSLMSPSEI